MSEYGIPYMGSKASICRWLIQQFPAAEHFYDVFGGGFSVTHAMLLHRSKDFKTFHFNEIRSGICGLVQKAIAGEYSYERFRPPFISREEFSREKELNAYIKIVWSFGNNGKNYLFSKEIEPYKKSMHNAVVFNEFDSLAEKVFGCGRFKEGYDIKTRRLFLRQKIEHYRFTGIPDFLWPFLAPEQLQQLEQLERLQRLEQLQQLERLEQLQRLQFTALSYEKVPILPYSLIYCDPPYKDTFGYDDEFDTAQFLDWACKQDPTARVFISEYALSDPRFKLLAAKNKRSLLKGGGVKKLGSERVYGVIHRTKGC